MADNLPQKSAPTLLDRFRAEVLPPQRRQELVTGMPKHMNPDRFERNLINALMQTPDLMQVEPRLIYREISKIAALGLYMDPQLGEAYLILGWNGKTKRKEPQARIGYRGLIKLARQSGEITMVYAHEVCANDKLDVEMGDAKRISHKPNVFGNRGPIVGYYSVVKYGNGETDFEPMSVAQIQKIRDRSDGWKAFSDGKIKSTPWSTDEEEMAKKTVIRRLIKRIPQSPEVLQRAIEIEDAAEHSTMQTRFIAHEEAAAMIPPPPPGDDEVIEQNSSVESQQRPHKADEAEDPAGGGDADSPPPVPADDDGPPAPPSEDGQESAGDQEDEDDLAPTLSEHLGDLEGQFQAARNAEDIERIYVETDIEATVSPLDGVEQAQALRDKFLARFERVETPPAVPEDDDPPPPEEDDEPEFRAFRADLLKSISEKTRAISIKATWSVAKVNAEQQGFTKAQMADLTGLVRQRIAEIEGK